MTLRIRQILKEQNKQVKWLAEQLGMTVGGLQLILSEKINVPLRRLEQIAEILNVDLTELFERTSLTVNCPCCGHSLKISLISEDKYTAGDGGK